MMTDKLSASQRIDELVTRFSEQSGSYTSHFYNETQTRRDFIDPFFKALGWDIDNEQGYAEAYREVIHEDKLKVEGSLKAPDYSFRLGGGKRLFFVEAKKPSIYVKEDIQPAYQVRRYGWSARHPISIITDFEEFAVYDCSKKPDPKDRPSVARIKYLTYKEYTGEFDFLWDTFSKEQVLKGSFDRFVLADTHKKGTTSVDRDFLESLDKWRTYLAVNISWNNRNLTEEEINFAVQQTIDRIIFLRITEDRHIEPYGALKHSLNHGEFYKNLFEIFRRADEKYNSGLFDLRKDMICESLRIDNKVIKTIINELYYPECPYEFSVIPVEILGSVYEQFLGKVIRITPAHHARIEEKPEVRKAGGVYYTPQYIVDYIVQNTVGKLIKGKTPSEISKVKIVDPACGSGSFLIGALQYLFDYHKNYYSNNGKLPKGKKDNPLTPEGQLTTAEKRRILINNIFGVDLDSNAVEVTKLSLLLKCMEGETEASINQQFRLFNERVLPTLDNNVRSGNSLIDTDFYDSQLDFGEEKQIRPFSWINAFPEILKSGGFDAVIGNPPYVRQEMLGRQKDYFREHYQVYHGMADLYSYFIEKSLKLINTGGLYGVIVANKWMRANYGDPLRGFLKSYNLYEIIDFGDLPVFETATTYPCIMIAGKPGKNNNQIRLTIPETLKFTSLSGYVEQNHSFLNKESLNDEGWSLAGDAANAVIAKIIKAGKPLGEYVNKKIYRGVLTGLNEAFVIDRETRDRLIAEDPGSEEIIKPFLTGREVKRYHPIPDNHYLILFPKGFTKEKGNNPKDAWKWLQSNYAAIAEYLTPFESKAKKRYDKGEYWWELRTCEYYYEFEKPKVIVPAIANSASYAFDNSMHYSNDKTSIIPVDDLYLLGLLNSNLLDFFIKSIASTKQGGYYEYKPMYLSKLPIKIIDESNKAEKQMKSSIIQLVERLLSLYNELISCKVPDKIEQLKSQICHFETRINELVYRIYGLTDEEIGIVEGN